MVFMHIIKNYLIISFLLLSCLSCSSGSSSGGTEGTGVRSFNGQVVDERAMPIAGVKISDKNSSASAITNPAGEYSLTVDSDASNIELQIEKNSQIQNLTLSGLESGDLGIKLDLQYLRDTLVKVAGQIESDQGIVTITEDQIKIENGDSLIFVDADGDISVGSDSSDVLINQNGEIILESDDAKIIINPDGTISIVPR